MSEGSSDGLLLAVINSARVSEEATVYHTILRNKQETLTHYRPAMQFGNRKIYFRRSFQFSIVTI